MADMYYNSKDVDYDAFYRQVGGDRYKPASSVTAEGLAIRPVQTVPINPVTGSPLQTTGSVINNIPTQGVQGAGTVAMPAGVRPNVTIPPLPNSNSLAYYTALNANDVIGGGAPPPQPVYQPSTINAANPINGWSLGLAAPSSQPSAVSAIASALAPKVAPVPMTLPGIMPTNTASSYAPSLSSSGGTIVYTVQPGDTLSSIAKDIYGSAQAYHGIAAANNIANPDKIQAGQKIILGTGTPTTGSAVAKALTGSGSSGSNSGSTYTIKSGDTLSAIAKANGTTVAELAAKNNISDPNKIFAGATLRI